MHRKFLPLALMYVDDQEPVEGRTRLQKMVFLLQKELEKRDELTTTGVKYEFVPYDYGPFSKDLYDDLDRMIEQRFVEDTEERLASGKVKYVYEIDAGGEDLVESQSKELAEAADIVDLAREIKNQYNDVLLSELIEYVYSEYPDYAERSVF